MAEHSLPTTCPVLFHDEHLVMVDKPAGLLSHPNPGAAAGKAAFDGQYDEKTRSFSGPGGKVWLIHRLDQDTSGVLLAALDAAVAARCRQAFEAGQVKKHYVTVVAGRPPARGAWKDALSMARGGGRVRTRTVDSAPLNAELHYENVSYSPSMRMSLLKTVLVTGRTHQIRVQAASRNHPVLGDDVYGDFALNKWAKKTLGLKRLFLHAAMLEFAHPVTGQMLKITAPLPADLSEAMEKLGLRWQ